MSLYKEFSTLLPYIQSVRKLKNYLSFDVSFPKTWKLPKKYVEKFKNYGFLLQKQWRKYF